MFSLFKEPFTISFLLIFLSETLSFLGFFFPVIREIIFFIIVFLVLFFSLKKLEYGLYVLLAELFIGSKGYLFYFDFGPAQISLRMAIFAVVIGVWLLRIYQKQYQFSFLKSRFFIFYFLFFIFLVWGLVAGFLYQNPLASIFFDANAWLYFLLLPIFFDVLADSSQIRKILRVLMASLSWLAVKTLFIFYIFTHQIMTLMPDLYRWTRVSGLGEITRLDSYYRVFFQSQIYSLIGLFIFLGLIVFSQRKNWSHFFLLPIFFLPLIISFSRSFWLGLIIVVPLFFLLLKTKIRFSWQVTGKNFFLIILMFLVSFGLIYFSLQLPPKVKVDWTALLEKRMEIKKEAAALSRLKQLPYLFSAIAENPFLGSGFGKTITYFSQDPRALEKHRTGLYATYAFEWGYLDFWIKFGLLGLFVYCLLIWQLLKAGWQKMKFQNSGINHSSPFLTFGLFLGLIVLLVTHFTSPYLNHPLGISYLILYSVMIDKNLTF